MNTPPRMTRAEIGALGEQLAVAGFAGATVAEVEPTIEDVFVNLVSRQR